MHLNQDKIRELRLDRGWTQQQLADSCGLSLRTIQRVEKEGLASLETTASLCAVFEVGRQTIIRVSAPEEQFAQRSYGPLLVSLLLGIVIGSAMTNWLM